MILLKTLLQEINLQHVRPYTVDFVWHGPEEYMYEDGDTYTCEIDCDGHAVLLSMDYSESSVPPSLRNSGKWGGAWNFAFFVRGESSDNSPHWTTQQDRGQVKGNINTLRLFRTIGLGIRDFVDSHHSIDIINITGADNSTAKGIQKSRIYIGFLESSTEFWDYRIVKYASHVYLVNQRRLAQPDASGIDTPNDPNM